jgi:hypothetical protein
VKKRPAPDHPGGQFNEKIMYNSIELGKETLSIFIHLATWVNIYLKE